MGNNFISKMKDGEVTFSTVIKGIKTFSPVLSFSKTFNLITEGIFTSSSLRLKINQRVRILINKINISRYLHIGVIVPTVNIVALFIYKRVLRPTIIIPFVNITLQFSSSTTIKELNIVFIHTMSIIYKGILNIRGVSISTPGVNLSLSMVNKKYKFLSDYDNLYLNAMDNIYLEDLDYTTS